MEEHQLLEKLKELIRAECGNSSTVEPHLKTVEFAGIMKVDQEVILRAIANGELVAVNVAAAGSVRPRWRIPESEAAKYLLRRTTKAKEVAEAKAAKQKQNTPSKPKLFV